MFKSASPVEQVYIATVVFPDDPTSRDKTMYIAYNKSISTSVMVGRAFEMRTPEQIDELLAKAHHHFSDPSTPKEQTNYIISIMKRTVTYEVERSESVTDYLYARLAATKAAEITA